MAKLPGESIGDGSCFSQESGNELQDNSVNFLPLLVFSRTCIRESIFSECQDAFVPESHFGLLIHCIRQVIFFFKQSSEALKAAKLVQGNCSGCLCPLLPLSQLLFLYV